MSFKNMLLTLLEYNGFCPLSLKKYLCIQQKGILYSLELKRKEASNSFKRCNMNICMSLFQKAILYLYLTSLKKGFCNYKQKLFSLIQFARFAILVCEIRTLHAMPTVQYREENMLIRIKILDAIFHLYSIFTIRAYTYEGLPALQFGLICLKGPRTCGDSFYIF